MNETKEHILKTSLILFLQKSYRDVTMKEIVQKTELSKGAFYHYFSSKEELFKEIVGMFMSMGEVPYSSFEVSSLKDFYSKYVDYIDNSMQQMSNLVDDEKGESSNFNFFLILFEAVNRFPEFLELELEMHKHDLDAWKSMIALARKNKEIKSSSSDEDLAHLFLYSTDGVFIRFINNDNTKPYKEYLQNAFDTIYTNIKV
ncbi:MAG: TetR/AcrR family transcriptional regulator [Marinilabiliales bacterium]|nr:MAG: TetR/AcrR family transcriptional regulator [Marinilabiliales bacterium]